MKIDRNSMGRPRGIGTIAFALLIFALASYGAVKAAVVGYAMVHCHLSTVCQSYSNSNNSGVFGKSTNSTVADQTHELGVGGFGNGGNGVYGTSTQRNSGYFDGKNSGFYALYADNSVTGGYLFGLSNTADGGFLSVDSMGNLSLSGTVTSGELRVRHSIPGTQDINGYSAESTGRTLEDVGVGRIVGGRGVIRLEPNFARHIEPNYFVFVTPLGKNHGLYVSAQNGAGFEVRESEGAASLAFNYRVVGTPIGSNHAHLPAQLKSGRPGFAGQAP